MSTCSETIFIVHGSNAHTWWRRLANGPYPWWRRWSLFCYALRKGFRRACEIREHRWSGDNTHEARIKAGADLAANIESRYGGRKVHIVGHSHGGNIALIAADLLPAGRIESIVLLANPNMALLDTNGTPPRWLYWGKAAERVARIWNVYSPEDSVQCRGARLFHGISSTPRSAVLVRPAYNGSAAVQDGIVHWNGPVAAHRAMHSSAMGTVVGKLLDGETFAGAMACAGLSQTTVNDVRDTGGSPGIVKWQEMIGELGDPRPFDLSSGREDVAVLLIHGFTASPSEMRPLADFIRQRTGWRCKAIVLPGHGTRVEDMDETAGKDWLDAVDHAYRDLSKGCRHVFLAGLSLGAVLCCHAGLRLGGKPGLRGMILLAPSFGISLKPALGLRVLRHVRRLRSKGTQAAHYFLDHGLFSYMQMPLNRAAEVIRLGGQAWKNLDKLKDVPVLVLFGELDKSVSLEMIRTAVKRNPWIRSVSLPKSRHILTVEPDSEAAFEASLAFMKECLGP